MGKRLLVNFWYSEPLGHVVEALRYCLGYHRADPTVEISLLLNAESAVTLPSLCPFIQKTYTVTFPFTKESGDAAAALGHVPSQWDWIVDDPRRLNARQHELFPNISKYYNASDRHFDASERGIAGRQPPGYLPNQCLRLHIPETSVAKSQAVRSLGSPTIAVLPAGGGPRYRYPSRHSWRLILDALISRFPQVAFCFIGKYPAGRRSSSPAEQAELDTLIQYCPRAMVCLDSSLEERLASVAACDLLLSPHSGFGMAALAVGTPWLSISGNAWPEFFFNDVAFHSVLPDMSRYPCFGGLEAESSPLIQDTDGEGPRTPSMCVERIIQDLPEILSATEDLVYKRVSYEQALRRYFGRLVTLLGPQSPLLWSIDDIHRRVLDDGGVSDDEALRR